MKRIQTENTDPPNVMRGDSRDAAAMDANAYGVSLRADSRYIPGSWRLYLNFSLQLRPKHIALGPFGTLHRQSPNRSFKAYRSRDATTGLTFKNFTFCPHCIYVFYLSENKQRLLRHTA